jgi:hypothetical protein
MTATAWDVRQLDVLLPAVAGGIMLAWAREGSVGAALMLTGKAVLLALIVGLAAWLLLGKSSSETEQRIFGASALLLLGGLADHLSLSALLSGLVAGVLWRLMGGSTAVALRRGIAYVQHPLLVLMLVVAGARTDVTFSALAVIVAYPAVRTAGKLAGAWCARRLSTPPLHEDLGMTLVAPGVFGIAFALNAVRAVGRLDPLLEVVVVGSIVSQFIAFRGAREPQT